MVWIAYSYIKPGNYGGVETVVLEHYYQAKSFDQALELTLKDLKEKPIQIIKYQDNSAFIILYEFTLNDWTHKYGIYVMNKEEY